MKHLIVFLGDIQRTCDIRLIRVTHNVTDLLKKKNGHFIISTSQSLLSSSSSPLPASPFPLTLLSLPPPLPLSLPHSSSLHLYHQLTSAPSVSSSTVLMRLSVLTATHRSLLSVSCDSPVDVGIHDLTWYLARMKFSLMSLSTSAGSLSLCCE